MKFFSYNTQNVKVNIKNVFRYNARENSIGIKDFSSNRCSDIIPSLHEAGHYIINNKSKSIYIIFKISQYITAVNRLIILPIYIVTILLKLLFDYETIFTSNIIIMNVMFYCFCIASLVRLFVGLTNEVFASLKAIVFIRTKLSKEILKLSKKMYFYAFVQQLFCFIIFTLFGIYNYFFI